jgi:hypothetical protein
MSGEGNKARGLTGPHRLMRVWRAKHDNGWATMVVENPDGRFSAWAAPDGKPVFVYTVEQEAYRGKMAAKAALEQKRRTLSVLALFALDSAHLSGVRSARRSTPQALREFSRG